MEQRDGADCDLRDQREDEAIDGIGPGRPEGKTNRTIPLTNFTLITMPAVTRATVARIAPKNALAARG